MGFAQQLCGDNRRVSISCHVAAHPVKLMRAIHTPHCEGIRKHLNGPPLGKKVPVIGLREVFVAASALFGNFNPELFSGAHGLRIQKRRDEGGVNFFSASFNVLPLTNMNSPDNRKPIPIDSMNPYTLP